LIGCPLAVQCQVAASPVRPDEDQAWPARDAVSPDFVQTRLL
jgi:hypothetical protein